MSEFELFRTIEGFIGTIQIAFFVCYLMPIPISLAYGQCKRGLIIATLLMGWTPLPWFILLLNIIEDNNGLQTIQDNQKEELKELGKIYKHLKENPDLFHKFLVELDKNQK